MHSSLASCWAPLFVVLACGGVAEQTSDHRPASGGGSELGAGAASVAGSNAGSGNVVPGGSGGSISIEVPVAGGAAALPGIREGNACEFNPPACPASGQFIDLEGEGRLAFPLDTSCGQCHYKCEVCDELTCSLWAASVTGCNKFQLRVAACAGPEAQPPCLDSTVDGAYYLDASGKRWNVSSLIGSEDQLPNPTPDDGPIDLELELTIGDGTTTRTIAVRAHVCASFYASLIIC